MDLGEAGLQLFNIWLYVGFDQIHEHPAGLSRSRPSVTQDVAQGSHHWEGLEHGGARTQGSGWLAPMTQEPLEKLLTSYNGSAEAGK